MCCWEETGFHHYQDVRDFSLDARSISASSGDCSCLVEESAYFPHAKLLPSSHHSGILEEEVPVPQTLHPDSYPSNKLYSVDRP